MSSHHSKSLIRIVCFFIVAAILFPFNGHFVGANSNSAPIEFHLWMDGSPSALPQAMIDSLREVTGQGNPLEEHTINEIYTSYYAREGYFNAQLDSVQLTDPDQKVLKIFGSKGCLFTIKLLNIDVVDNDPEIINGFHSFYGIGDHYNALRLQEEFYRYIRYFESLGFPLVKLEITEFEPDIELCEVSLNIEITTGSRFYVNGVRTNGLKQYDPEYIQIATGIRIKDLVTPDLLERGRRNLINTRFFHKVSEGDIIENNNEVYVYYNIVERRANNFDLMFAYIPGQVEGYNIAGRGQLLIRNVGWAGSTLNIAFNRLENMSTRLKSEYERQWVMGYPAGGSIDFRFLQQDTTYQIRNWRVSTFYNWSPENKIILSLRQENTSANSAPVIAVQALDGVTRAVGIGYDFDNTDNLLNPSQGMKLHFYIETGFRRITDERVNGLMNRSSMMQQRFNARIQHFYNFFPRQVASWQIYGSAVESPEYAETDLLRLGGSRSIRGYGEEQFHVARTLWSDMEYRYLLDDYSHAFIFLAGGIYERPAIVGLNDNKTSEWLYSGGIGFQYRTPIGIMQFTYAVSADDPLHNGKVHFNLSTEF